MAKFYDSVADLVGETPMVNLSRLAKKHKCKAVIMAKCECYNPFFSVKDRIALSMIEVLEKNNKIKKDTVLLEATSGNTGVALAGICAARGYKLVIVMPEGVSKERIFLIKHFGAEVILTPSEDGMIGAVRKAELLASKNKDVVMFRQFENEANPNAHRFGTSMEIFEALDGNVDAIVAGVGTAGTIAGIASTLKSNNPDLKVFAVEPKESAVLNGKESGKHKIFGIGAGFVPPFYEKDLVDEVVDVSSDDAIEFAKEAALVEGLPIGISAGAALKAAVDVAKKSEMKDKTVVVILPDAVERYISVLSD